MRTTYDFTPFFRSSIGFDRVFDLLGDAEPSESWPPYDIVRTGEDGYRIAMAVAGFGPDELKLVYQPNLLVLSGDKAGSEEASYPYRGIAGRRGGRCATRAFSALRLSANCPRR